MSSAIDPNTRNVTVCSECLRASCWHCDTCCEQYRTANTTKRTVGQLRALALEHPSDYCVRKVRRACGDSAVAGYEQFEGSDEADEPCFGCGKPWSAHLRARPPGVPQPRMPCLGLKSGYQPRRVAR